MNKKIYFDNAATTFPKPECVYRRADSFARNFAGNPGRGAHFYSVRSSEEIFLARKALAELFSANPENISFTMNTTYALNMAVKSSVCEEGHVVISNMEHNSVLRPTAAVCAEKRASYSIFEVSDDENETLENLKRSISEKTCAVICTHMSNIVPVTLPIGAIGAFCREKNIRFIVDGAQSAGLLPINMKTDNIDILCIPGHKGLYGFQGVGALLFGEEMSPALRTLIEGGSGSDSIPLEMPNYFPDRFEAGTLPAPAVSSLGEGARWVASQGTEKLFEHDRKICEYIIENTKKYGNILNVYNKRAGHAFLFNIGSMPASQTSALYDKYGICLRAGLHCAPLAHRTVKTFPYGAVRASFGAFNTLNEAKYFCEVTERIIKEYFSRK